MRLLGQCIPGPYTAVHQMPWEAVHETGSIALLPCGYPNVPQVVRLVALPSTNARRRRVSFSSTPRPTIRRPRHDIAAAANVCTR